LSVVDRLHALTLLSIERVGLPGLERAIAQGHTAAWISGTSERLGITPGGALLNPRNLSRAERADIKARIAEQLRYLEGFKREAQGMSEAAIKARSALYAGAVRATYALARWGDWELPWVPGDGSSECLGNCRCSASVKDNEDGTGVYTWVLGAGAAERHCTTCPTRAGDHPVKRRRAA
jgi:hypothetical protein